MKTQLPLIFLLGITSAFAAPKAEVDAQAEIRDPFAEGAGDAKTHTTTFSKSVTITSDGNRTVKKTVIDRNGEREEFTETTDGEGNDPGKAEARAGANAGNGAPLAQADGVFKGAGLTTLLDNNADIPEEMRNMILEMLEQLQDQENADRDNGKKNSDEANAADDE